MERDPAMWCRIRAHSVGSGCNGTLHPYDTIRVEVWSPNSSAAAALQWDVSHTIEGVTYDRMESMAIPNLALPVPRTSHGHVLMNHSARPSMRTRRRI